MAESRAIINVDINTSDAAAGLRQLQSQINAFNSTLTKSSAVQATAMRNAKDNLLELVNASRFFTAETVKMQTAAAGLDKTLSKGQVTLGQFFGAKFRKDGAAAAQILSLANARAAALQTQFVATGAAANGFREAIAIRPLQSFNDAAVVSAQKLAIQRAMLNQATTSMINFGKNTQWAGRQLMVGFTVPLSIFGAMAGKTFMDLEKEVVNFKKVYGDAFTPPAEMEQNLFAVKELAKEFTKYGIAVKDTVGLAAQAAAAGAQNKDLIDATTQSTRLATLGQMDQNQALETTISLQNAFRLSGDELAKSINFLNMVENQTVVTLQDLTAAIPRVAPVIQGLGGSVEDLAAFLAAMEEGGVSAEQGANALKSGLASLINPTDRAVEKLQALGISLDTIIEANRGDLMGTVQAFSRALQTVDEFSRQQALEQVFGKFQYARLGALFDNITKSGSQASRVIDLAGMSAIEMAASAEKELSAIEESAGTKLVAAMERLKIAIAPIGELFVKIATPVVNLLTTIAEKFNSLPDGTKKFIGIATVITGVVIPAGTMFLGLLMNLVGTLVKFGNIVGLAFKGFIGGGFKGAFDNVSQALRYMSLSELDAQNSAIQLAGATEGVNAALRSQVGASEGAQSAVMELALAYEVLTQQMNEAAAANKTVFGVGAAAMGATTIKGGPRVRRNRGGTIPGSGNTDTVPAMLTPGEFVINKQATKENLPLLKAINSGKMIGLNGGAFIGARLAAAVASVRGRPLASLGNMGDSLQTRAMGSLQTVADVASRTIGGRTQIPRLSAIATMEEMATIPIKGLGALVLRLPGSSLNQKLNRRGVSGSQAAQAIIRSNLSIDDIFEPFEMQRRAYLTSRGLNSVDMPFNKNSAYSKLLEDLNSYQGIIKDEQFARIVKNSIRANLSGNNSDDFMNAITRSRALKVAKTPGEKNEDFAKRISADLSRLGSNATITTDVSGRKTRVFFNKDGIQIEITPDYEFGYLADLDDGLYDYTELRRQLRSVEGAQLTHANSGGYIVPGQGNKDTIPAMLTPGEFVINKKATQSNLALLQAINNGSIAQYARGGRVELVSSGRGRSFEYAVIDPEGNTIGFFPNKKDAEAARMQSESDYKKRINARRKKIERTNRTERTASMLRGMGGMKGMGISMGAGMAGGAMMMGAGMVQESNPSLATAMNFGGMAMSMGSMLPMLAPMLAPLAGIAVPALAVTAALGITAAALYAWRKSVDGTAKEMAEFGSNIGGTANALDKMGAILGKQTPAEQRTQSALRMTEEDKAFVSNEFAQILATEEGNKFIEELKNASSEDRFKKLTDYLRSGIAAGMLDQAQAQSFAKAVGAQLGDIALGTAASTAVRTQATGPDAMLNIARKRVSAVQESPAVQSVINAIEGTEIPYQQASIAIGAAAQVTQDYANVIGIAEQQWKDGQIEHKKYIDIVNEAKKVQEEYNGIIRTAITQSTDRGAVEQAVESSLVAGGDISPEQIQAFRDAVSVGISTLGGGQRIGVTDSMGDSVKVDTAFEASYMQAKAAEQGTDLQTMYDKNYDAFKALREEALKAKDATIQLTEEGLQEYLLTAVDNNEITMDEATKLGVYLANNPLSEAAQAYINEDATAAEMASMINASNAEITGFTEKQIDQYTKLGTALEKAGIPLPEFEAHILSLPEAVREAEMQKIEQLGGRPSPKGISIEEKQRMQAEYVRGSSRLEASLGQPMARSITGSEAYKKALLKEGGAAKIEDAFQAAKDAGVAENVINYVIKTEGANDPEDMIDKMEGLTKAQEDIMSLPDEMIKGLDIDIKNPEDLEKFGPMVDSLKENWSILENLNPNIDLVASMKYLTLDADNKELSPQEAADRLAKLNKAWKKLEGGNKKVRKEALFEIATAYAGNTEVAGKSPAEVAQIALDELRNRFENFDDLDPLVQEQLIQTEMNYQILGLPLVEENARLQKAITDELAKPEPDYEAIRHMRTRVESNNAKMGAAKEKAIAQQTAIRSKGGSRTTSGGGSGGGSKEKTLMQELKDQSKLSGKFIEEINNLRGPQYKKFISGPFAPEFLDYLRSQGEKGLKLIKGGLDKVKQAYALFVQDKSSQLAAQAMSLPFVLANQLKTQKKDFAFRKDLVDQGFSLEETRNIADQTKEYRLQIQVNKDLIREEMKKKKAQRDQGLIERLRKENGLFGKGIKSIVKYAKEFSKLSKEEKNFEALQSATENMNDEFDLLSRQSGLVAAGFNSELAAAMANAGLSASSSSDQLSKFADQFERIQVMNATLDPIGFNLRGLQIQADILANNERIAELQKEIAVQEQIEPLRKELETYEKQNEQLSRKIELRQRDLEPLDESIETLELERETAEKSYDARLEALDKILNLEESLLAVREKNLDVADALSRGDITAASKAAIEVQKEMARQSATDQRTLLERQRQLEIEGIDERINVLKDKRKVIEDDIKSLQLQQRGIQDTIYIKQQFINSETERLNNLYGIGKSAVESLKNELEQARLKQIELNNAAAEFNKIKGQIPTPAQAPAAQAPAAQAPSGPQPMTLPGFGIVAVPSGWTPAGGGQTLAPTAVANTNKPATLPGFGITATPYTAAQIYAMTTGQKSKKKAFGGMINYSGSREPAPGMMYGGKMKGYAAGSYVAGNGMLDSVPALLTPGEFVVRKPVAQMYGPMLESLNGNVFPRANFNRAMPRGTAKDSGSMYNYNVNVTLNGTDMNPDDVANVVMQKIKMKDNMNVRNYNYRG